MPEQHQSASSSQASSGSSNASAWDYTIPRIGKVSAVHQMFIGALGAFIHVIPVDKKGPLKDEDGISTTHDKLGRLTITDRPLVVDEMMLAYATTDNVRQAKVRGEDVTDPLRFIFKMDDPVSLEYSSKGCLTAVKKINEESPEGVGGIGEERGGEEEQSGRLHISAALRAPR
ncbi:MAG: hypothetical protein ASARMPREDX12_001122 [Alectoria sarmentosa]|nr:MAG: hypothetical protein ASARMPREDX12_001122 [Alectoria sarmentosa]